MTPKLASVATAMAKLHHGLDTRAEKILARIEKADARSTAAFAAAHRTLDDADRALDDVDKFVSTTVGANGGPILDGSGESSANTSQQPEPQTSWAGAKVA